MVFTYQDGLKVRDLIQEKYNGIIKRHDLAIELRKFTNVMSPWWIQSYMQSMVNADMLSISAEGIFSVKEEKNAS